MQSRPFATFETLSTVRLHLLPLTKLAALLVIACASICHSTPVLDRAAELWTARFGSNDDKTLLVRHYQQEMAAAHGWHIYSAAEMRKRFAASGVPVTVLSDAVISR